MEEDRSSCEYPDCTNVISEYHDTMGELIIVCKAHKKLLEFLDKRYQNK